MSVVFLPHAQAVTLGGIGGKPTHTEVYGEREWLMYSIEPGSAIIDSIDIINNTAEEVTVRLYAADSTGSSDGTFAVEQASEEKNTIGAWVRLSTSTIVVPPYSSAPVEFTLVLPQDHSIAAGTYAGGIMIEDTTQYAETLEGVVLSTRTGVRVYVTVPGEVRREVVVQEAALMPLSHTPAIMNYAVRIQNAGNVAQALRLETTVDMAEPWLRWFGLQQLPWTVADDIHILPNTTRTVQHTMHRPWLGNMCAQSLLRYADESGEQVMSLERICIVGTPPWYIIGAVWIIAVYWIVAVMRFILRKVRRVSKK